MCALLLGCAFVAFAAAGEEKRIEIVSATWNADEISVDVTEKIKGLVIDGDVLPAVANNSLVDKDIKPKAGKTLKIAYTVGGEAREATLKEGEKKIITSEKWTPTKEPAFFAAYYGVPGMYAVVTEKVEALLKKEGAVLVDNKNFGDPARGHGKHCLLVYACDNAIKTKNIPEHKTFEFKDLD